MGTMLEVLSKKGPTAKRATTYVRARYKYGENAKDVEIALQRLLAQNPKPNDVPPANTTTTNNNNNNENPSGGSNNNDNTPAAATTAAAAAAATTTTTTTGAPENAAAGTLPPPDGGPPAGPLVVTTAHDRNWFDGNNVHSQINGPVLPKHWKIVNQWSGDELTCGCDNNSNHFKISEYECFMSCFPKDQLFWMVRRLNLNLSIAGKKVTTTGELLKWFGVLVLITRFEYGERASLWSPESSCRYLPPPLLGQTGMTRPRFDELTQHMEWSEQPEERPPGLSSETYRWMLVDDFVSRINSHRVQHFSPSHLICVDESISRWYGLGGSWINAGLPFYVAIDRKPEDGCEIQNSCCAKSGIMLRLKIVKSPVEEANK